MVVYVKEAHATDYWWLGRSRTQRLFHEYSGNPARLDVAEPVTMEQRRKVAASCQADLFEGVVPLYVDTMKNEVNEIYAARPTRMYLIDRDGRIVYNPGLGPFGFNPNHLDREIERYLSEHPAS